MVSVDLDFVPEEVYFRDSVIPSSSLSVSV